MLLLYFIVVDNENCWCRLDNGVFHLRLGRLRSARDVRMSGASSLDPPDILVKRSVHVHVGKTEQHRHAQALRTHQKQF